MSERNITDSLTLVLAKFMGYRQKLIVAMAYKNGVISIFLMSYVKIIEQRLYSNGHSTSNLRRFDADITSIRRRLNFDEFPGRFHVLFSM